MKFYVSTGFLDTREIVEIAKAADELGYEGLGIPDHVVNLDELDTPYPYSDDGQRGWEPFTHWPDPWVLMGHLASVTTRLRFVTTVYVAALRDPYSAANPSAPRPTCRTGGSNWASGWVGVVRSSN
ncbi:putative oxidoreductase [Gordonia rhizosphera NBRC 16068]|uniref:Putative oxidoreductase n=1 Tax=Gordonia rhizosphera NBRC 16068 TaxID=1108045 RepID=K6V8Y0_9ACTN|nr:putative oxidoreductase [Gordonia rhizosphera NBRC 16068]